MMKKDKGITLISLSIAVIIILTITGMILYSAKDNIYIKNLTNMQNDIANLRDKISLYYSEYGDIPAKTEYPDITNLKNAGVIGTNDTANFLIIELEELNGLTLNYGGDYETYKEKANKGDYTNLEDLTDIYIINEDSHNIFYVEGIRVKENNTTKMYYTDYTQGDTQSVKMKIVDGVIIPNEFYYVGGTKDSGLVITDDSSDENAYKNEEIVGNDLKGNQFVWVPVENFSEFKREHFGTSSQKWWTGTFVTDGLSANNLYEPVSDGTKDETEVDKMYKSVKENKGFYVGRYEAGTTETSGTGIRGDLVCKQGVNVYNNIKWGNSISDERGGAVEVARGMYSKENGNSVTSTLMYGVQWDAIMRWMKDEPNLTEGKYVQDSTDMGWYNNNSSGNQNHLTGKDLNEGKNAVKNIYDLAGNVEEWTMESFDTFAIVNRGGIYNFSGSDHPVSSRNRDRYPSRGSADNGFRVALYLNIDDEETSEDSPVVETKEFTIDGVVYKFEEGMNFGTWVNSKYNTNEWKISPSSYVTNSTYTKTVRDLNGNLVYYNTKITENINYITLDV